MTSAKHLLRLLIAGLGSAWVATACVRLQKPDQFVCNVDSDCADDERCGGAGYYCVPKDSCAGTLECPKAQHCNEEQRCVADECTTETELAVCKGSLCLYGSCVNFCSSNGCRQGFRCEAETCVPGDPLADGKTCSANTDCASFRCCDMTGGKVCSSGNCPRKVGLACAEDYECASNHCCADRNGNLGCTANACDKAPECLKDADCFFGQVCVGQECKTNTSLKSTGDACFTSSECASGSCVQGVCRGMGKGGAVCYVDADCEANRLCCKAVSTTGNTCSELNKYCPGVIGGACASGKCLGGGECTDNGINGFCTKPCANNAACGASPWGVPNVCAPDDLGVRMCFPGCTTPAQCSNNLGSDFDCSGEDGASQFCTQN